MADNEFKELKEFFKNDIYALETTGIKIENIEKNKAVCSLKIEKKHLNAGNVVQGGAIFTLADFTFALAANTTANTVSLNNTISYINPAKSGTIFSTAKLISEKKHICVYSVDVTDEDDNIIATMQVEGYRMPKK